MKFNSKLIMGLAIVSSLVFGNSSYAADLKVAVVDIQAVVSQSSQVKALKDEQLKKAQDLAKWLETVNADVQKQSSEANKKKLFDKYNADLAAKKAENAKEYAKKLAEIDKSISAIITAKAKEAGYGLVLPKTGVLYGGVDITKEISKQVK